jgi:hypothetical protein
VEAFHRCPVLQREQHELTTAAAAAAATTTTTISKECFTYKHGIYRIHPWVSFVFLFLLLSSLLSSSPRHQIGWNQASAQSGWLLVTHSYNLCSIVRSSVTW